MFILANEDAMVFLFRAFQLYINFLKLVFANSGAYRLQKSVFEVVVREMLVLPSVRLHSTGKGNCNYISIRVCNICCNSLQRVNILRHSVLK